MEGKVFTVTWGEQSYEISAMIDWSELCYELKLNDVIFEKKMLKPGKSYYFFELEQDEHSFLIFIQRVKHTNFEGKTATEYRFECFADGISVSDGVTTLECFVCDMENELNKPLSKPKIHIKETLLMGAVYVASFFVLVLIARWIAFDSIKEAAFRLLLDVAVIAVLYCAFVIPYVLISKYCERQNQKKLCLRLRQYMEKMT